MAKYQVGELSERIQIIRINKTEDGQGGFKVDELLIHTLWALVRPKSGDEVNVHENLNTTANKIFVVRNHSGLGIEEADLIRWRGNDFNIRAVLDRGPRETFIEIDAESGVAQ
jgi:head-tail adaptor